jgi:hypothetical protein
MSVIRQLRHKCYSIPLHLHVVSSNKSAGILPYDSLECYNNVKSSAACFGGWRGIIFHSFVSPIWWFSTIRIKYTSEVWRLFKYEYHSKPCALLITLLGYPLSNASVFADIIFKIIMNQCDCKKTRNEQSITFQIYVIWQSNTTFYYIYIYIYIYMTFKNNDNYVFRLSFLIQLQLWLSDILIYSWQCFKVRDLFYINSSMIGYNT